MVSDDGDTWAIDGLIIGGNMVSTIMLHGDFQLGISEEDWLFYPGGRLDRFCPPTLGGVRGGLRSSRSTGLAEKSRFVLRYLIEYFVYGKFGVVPVTACTCIKYFTGWQNKRLPKFLF